MNIVFLTHPTFANHQSMPRFARMLSDGMTARGHTVTLLSPQMYFYKLRLPKAFRKWLAYVDQFLIFSMQLRQWVKRMPEDTLFVVTDHALGPWVPLVAGRPHVVHCHDFLAQRSAKHEIAENPTSWTGRLYQRYIHAGYSRGRNFISVSRTTKQDLHRFLPAVPACSEVVYNGLNQTFGLQDVVAGRAALGEKLQLDLSEGYLLHVGGNQWYKNRLGVLEIYFALRKTTDLVLPLLLIGEAPTKRLLATCASTPYFRDVYWLGGVDDASVTLSYAGASAFLFPSLAEGFGWPIAEAMASGCPVVTTNEPPMTEVAGEAGFYIPRRPTCPTEIQKWATDAARVLHLVLTLPSDERRKCVAAGLQQAQKFDTNQALDRVEEIYKRVLEREKAMKWHLPT